jgi:predicted small lipoprotein YifL
MKPCIALLLATLLAACGASGGLYLPDQAPQHDKPLRKERKTGQQQTPPAPAPADGSATTPPPSNTP